MENFQLYRTNIPLGGQMKWDLIVESGPKELYVSDFHLTPISRAVPYNRYVQDTLLNYSHLENIKSYYKQVEGSFYSEYADPRVTSKSATIVDVDRPKSQNFDTHNSVGEMGLKRSQYSIYHKQFEYFCPLWLEDIRDRYLRFDFSYYTIRNGKPFATVTKSLSFKPTDKLLTYHNKFVNYFNQYIQDISLNDSVAKVDLSSTDSYISGIDTKTGKISLQRVPTLSYNLLRQERLLMDADALLIQSFSNNHIIAKQLFNFNFVFDLGEILDGSTLNSILGRTFVFNITANLVDMGGNVEVLSKKDFYTNYDYIESKHIGDVAEGSADVNIFDELMDNYSVDLIDKNKAAQPTIHWSLVGNNDYIFNTYPGFGGYILVGEDKRPVQINTMYQNSPNIWTQEYSAELNNIGWCNYFVAQNSSQVLNELHRIELDRNHRNEFMTSIGGKWSMNLQYEPSDTPLPKLLIITAPDSARQKIQSSIKDLGVLKSGDKYAWITNVDDESSVIICFNSNRNAITFSNIRKAEFLVDGLPIDVDNKKWGWVNKMIAWLNTVKEPNIYSLDTCLGYTMADGPSNPLIEVQHYKVPGNKSIIRYDGLIKPTFVSPDLNLVWRKCLLDKNNNPIPTELANPASNLLSYNRSGYAANYPSLQYYPWYATQPALKDGVIESPGEQIQSTLPYEYSWYDNSVYMLLSNEISFALTYTPSPSDTDATIRGLIIDYLATYYKVDGDRAIYIFNQYDCRWDWDYAEKDNIEKYIYNVKLTLK